MPSELTCAECSKTAEVELRQRVQMGESAARVYFLSGELEDDVPEQLLLNARRAWYEEPSTGLTLCAPCMMEIADGESVDDLGRLEDGSLHFDFDPESL